MGGGLNVVSQAIVSAKTTALRHQDLDTKYSPDPQPISKRCAIPMSSGSLGLDFQNNQLFSLGKEYQDQPYFRLIASISVGPK